ncbi:MAG TPA: response regulator, partial [Candidatus Deferrimicrobium sp.]|nr:response regulator [Candidatus Deferrimicrobium sp.]
AFRGVLVKAGTAKFIIPILDVERTLRVRPGDIKTVEKNRETILIDGRAVSHITLADVLKMPREPQSDSAPQFIQMLLLSANGIQIAFSVDEVLDKEEALVKSLGRQLRRVINISGAVILGSAEVVPILNVPDLIKSAVKMSGQPPVLKEKIKIPKPESVLLVEDSITSRMLLKNIMESAGYRVTTAVDGAAGWDALQQESFDIVVLDVDLPGMDGFELTAKIRANKNLAAIPVVLITDLENGADREKGIEVGANAYIVKSKFDQGNLLAVLKKLV